MRKTKVKETETITLRNKAEQMLKEGPLRIASEYSQFDILKLIHELQVYHIELQLQNEELLLAHEQGMVAIQKYTDLYEFAPIGYFTISSDGKINELNKSGSQMLGKERSQIIDARFDSFVSYNSKSTFSMFLENVFSSNTMETCELSLTTSGKIPIYVYVTALAEENKNFCRLTMADITQRRQTEIELIKAKEHAEESDRLKSAFLQNISHEIRTPMNGIMGFSKLITKNYNNKQKLEQFAHIIDQRCTDLLDIITDILDIAKIESGQISVHIQECNLNDLFDELGSFFKEYQKRIDKHHIEFKLQVHCNVSNKIILTDKVKLRQIFINLITNAFKFTDKGTIEGGCTIDDQNKLVFYLSDTGIGIPPDKHEQIFKRFAQLSQGQSRLFGGTGLGLSIVNGLVNLLGGKIWLESELGKGTKFSFTIPVQTMHQILAEPIISDVPRYFEFSDKTILLVEDEDYNAAFMKEILSDSEINIIYAELGADAIQIAKTQFLDLILMDIRLPDMDGFEVMRQIKQHNPEIKIIVQSAYAAAEDIQKASDAGSVDYICKPIDPDILLTMLNKHLA